MWTLLMGAAILGAGAGFLLAIRKGDESLQDVFFSIWVGVFLTELLFIGLYFIIEGFIELFV